MSSNPPPTLYIANRGLWSTRISRTARWMGFRVVGGVCKGDSNNPTQVSCFDEHVILNTDPAQDVDAMLDIPQVIAAAKKLGAHFVHPGIGLLSENAEFARAVMMAGMIWVGPSPESLEIFGNKFSSVELASRLHIPTLSLGLVVDKQLTSTQATHLPVLFKAMNGGGGLGHRIVTSLTDVASAHDRCISESSRSFHQDIQQQQPSVLCEKYLAHARHIEVQIVGDGSGNVLTFGTRECSAQRRFQKVIEVAPAPHLPQTVTEALLLAAKELGRATQYKSLGTVEFLVDCDTGAYYFIEVNPRLQVEHTVTEELFNVDLVRIQLLLAQGHALTTAVANVTTTPLPVFAIQCRINAEIITSTGVLPVSPQSQLRNFEIPTGRGVRFETCLTHDCSPNVAFDSLIGLIIFTLSTHDFAQATKFALHRLANFHVGGTLPTNLSLLQQVLALESFSHSTLTTRFIDETWAMFKFPSPPTQSAMTTAQDIEQLDDGDMVITSPMFASVLSLQVKVGDLVQPNQLVVLLSALKMEHEIINHFPTRMMVTKILVKPGDKVDAGMNLIVMKEDASSSTSSLSSNTGTTTATILEPNKQIMDDFFQQVTNFTLDSSRPTKTNRPHPRLTARSIVNKLLDDKDDWIEYGRFGHHRGRPDAVGDAIICGIGHVSGVRCMLIIYDYTVMAGTQGLVGHLKMDRMFDVAKTQRLPVICFPEGGGGRAGDNAFVSSGLDNMGFFKFAQLRDIVPVIAGVSGFCFAGNAALLGSADLVVAASNGLTSIGMGGPAMIEGGGLGVVRPEDVGPVDMHVKNGFVDKLVPTDGEMVDVVRKLVAYLGTAGRKHQSWTAPSETTRLGLRHIVPHNRKRSFDMHRVLHGVFDEGSVLELKEMWGRSVLVGFAFLCGYPIGFIASDCRYMSGALDADASSKMAWFLGLCSSHNVNVVSFSDTPGFLVGVTAETQGLVRRAGELFVAGAKFKPQMVFVIVRRCYGLGGQALCGGSLKAPCLSVSWPTGELGAMGFEGAVRLGYRHVIRDDPTMFDKLVAKAYEKGKVSEIAAVYELDDIVDPADTRMIVFRALFGGYSGGKIVKLSNSLLFRNSSTKQQQWYIYITIPMFTMFHIYSCI